MVVRVFESILLRYGNTGWRRETGKFEVDYEILPRGQVPSAHAIRTQVRNFEEL
jgi:hypothetical protein